MVKILVTGANGQVGFELCRALATLGEVVAVTREQLDLADPEKIRQVLDEVRPSIIVNPAAYTAVDKAESEVDQAMAINAVAPGVLAEWTETKNALLIHYSTDYVFDGRKNAAYREDDQPCPQSVYGNSKLLGEEVVRTTTRKYLILRTSWVFGAHGNNFLKTILRLARERERLNIVADQVGAPTSAALIADVTAQIIARYYQSTEKFEYGTYHLTAQGEISWYGYARYVIQRAVAQCYPLRLCSEGVYPIPTTDYPLPANRPANSRLDCSKLASAFCIQLPQWQEGVDLVITQLNTSSVS
ncbi:dTDP-4-dehydrorhamnose reductase [Serratia sp. S1B]|nr:dTDP-4-dehydrorhamnose reductase [Serratia sp. S1B]